VDQRTEIGHQRPAVILRAGMIGHCFGKCTYGLDIAPQSSRMQSNGDGGLLERGKFGLDLQSFGMQLAITDVSLA
jgi:hypothetical protein